MVFPQCKIVQPFVTFPCILFYFGAGPANAEWQEIVLLIIRPLKVTMQEPSVKSIRQRHTLKSVFTPTTKHFNLPKSDLSAESESRNF